MFEGRKTPTNPLDTEVPVIAAANGPARVPRRSRCCRTPCRSAGPRSSRTRLQDMPHFVSGVVPGDGAHLVWTRVLGPNRGRCLLRTGQEPDARTAVEYGVGNEVPPADALVDRVWEAARSTAAEPFLTRRCTRPALVRDPEQAMTERLGTASLARRWPWTNDRKRAAWRGEPPPSSLN